MINNSVCLDDIIKIWESLPKIDKSEMIKVIYCNKDTLDKLLNQLGIVQWDEMYPNYCTGIDVLIRESVPDNFGYIEMQDGSVKILELE